MAENLLTAPLPDATAERPAAIAPDAAATGVLPANGRPPQVPEKFWDARTGQIRVDVLLKSYLELERRLSQSVPLPGPERNPAELRRLHAALGVPERPEEYCVECSHGLFQPDAELNARMHAGGFTPGQVQLVYDLAAERLVPLIREVAAQFEADREIARLAEHFGGEPKWREVSRQMLAWGRRNLPKPALEGLSTSYDGVMALYRMMTSDEPVALRGGAAPAAADETELRGLMRDARYWRDKDPAVVAKVTDGFRRLYPGEG